MANVSMIESGPTAGIWIECDKGMIGLVGQDGVSAFLVLYGKNDGRVHGAPELAIGTGEIEDGATVQFPGPGGSFPGTRIIPLSRLLSAVAGLFPPDGV